LITIKTPTGEFSHDPVGVLSRTALLASFHLLEVLFSELEKTQNLY